MASTTQPANKLPQPPAKSAASTLWAWLTINNAVRAMLVFLLAAILVARLWIVERDVAVANLITFSALVLCGLVVWAWFVLFSSYRLAWRSAAVIVSGSLIVLAFSVVREVRFSGEMIPKVYWKWQPVADRALEAPAVMIEPTAAVPLVEEEGFPQFLGPDRTGYLPYIQLDHDWGTNPPQERWRVKIGAGWSGFVAHSNRAVTLEQRGDSELVTCYDIKTGDIRWSHATNARHDEVMGGVGPRSTPTIDGERVYALGATGVLTCLDFATGKLLWEDNLRERAGTTDDKDGYLVQWGRSNSPLVVDEKVIVPLGGKEPNYTSLIAYHKETGEVLWKGGEQQISYSSPALGAIAGQEQIVIVNESSLAGHDPSSGDELWRYQWFGRSNADASASQPHVLAENQIFISKGYQGGAKLLKIAEREGKYEPTVVWENNRVLKTKFTNCVLIGDYAYGLSDSTLECVDWHTGKSRWKKGRYGQGQILGVGDALLVQAEPGFVALVSATPEKFTELGRLEAMNDKTWNNLCVYRDLLLVRNSVEAVCYGLTLKKE